MCGQWQSGHVAEFQQCAEQAKTPLFSFHPRYISYCYHPDILIMATYNIPQTFVIFPILIVLSNAFTIMLYHGGSIDRFVVPELTKYVDKRDIPFACFLFLVIFTYVLSPQFARVAHLITSGRMDNSNPRAAITEASGFAQRCYAAHQNLVEGMAMFLGAIIIAHAKKVELKARVAFALIHTISRIVFYFFYLIDMDQARSFTFEVGCLSCIYLLAWSVFGDAFSTELSKVSVMLFQQWAGAAKTFRSLFGVAW
ncbi:hypothetical protein BKA69DRAFT_835366 [Paraphysoderma sedebokerense]|nr:hypothetical protein BKA69DRAFT_835366 [Paraphysoderma sedebokerense]